MTKKELAVLIELEYLCRRRGQWSGIEELRIACRRDVKRELFNLCDLGYAETDADGGSWRITPAGSTMVWGSGKARPREYYW